jgi:glycosyltransferase involved in cell wall biosynthesis
MSGLPVVCIFGVKSVSLRSSVNFPDFETGDLDCRCYFNDDDLEEILAKDNPNVIVTVGNPKDFPKLMRSSNEISEKWINFKNTDDLDKIGNSAFYCFISSTLNPKNLKSKVSIITPTYNTADLNLPYKSLLNQTYKNWEWVIFDDSDDNDVTFNKIKEIVNKDSRVSVYKSDKNSGVIGDVKYRACALSKGDILVELDHDDELTSYALKEIVDAFDDNPEAGFVYTDFAEVNADGSPIDYGKNWGHGYGSYKKVTIGGKTYNSAQAPNINPKTIRHIVASPNHARCWRRDFYFKIGGHNRKIHVADDYELIIRTFLNTRMVRIPKLCYIQHRGDAKVSNTHKVRSKEIQRLVRSFSDWYDREIHDRFTELGVDDYMYKKGENSFWKLNTAKNPTVEQHCTILVEK